MSGSHPPDRGIANHESHPNISKDHLLWPFLGTLWARNSADRPTMSTVAEFLRGHLGNQPRDTAGEEHVRTTQSEDPPAPLHPELELLKTEALRHVVQLTKERGIGKSIRLSNLLKRLDLASAPELEGELIYLRRNVDGGTFSNVSKSILRRILPDGSESEETVAVKALRVGQLFGARRPEIEERVKIRLKREFQVWINLNHRNILKLYGFRFEADEACLLSPWCENRDLAKFLANTTPPDLRIRLDLALQVGHGLTYLHHLDPPISHGDVKPSNVLLVVEAEPVSLVASDERTSIYKARDRKSVV